MISYGFSIQGKSHIRHGTICQDYNKVIRLSGNWMLGMVADGVGSAPLSDEGSKMAVERLGEFFQKKFSMMMASQDMENLLCQGYRYAMDEIARYAEENNQSLEKYDTTLSVALFDGEKLVYGHSGDGGILARLYNGKTIIVTKRQKGADGNSVIPLRAGESGWFFGTCNEKVADVLLATDGILDGVLQPIFLNQPLDLTSLAKGDFPRDNVYVTAAEFFMNPDCVYRNKKIRNPDDFMKEYLIADFEKESQERFWECISSAYIHFLGKANTEKLKKGITKYFYLVWALKKVTDDKSVVCIMNEKAKVTPQSFDYYQEPNWKWRIDRHNAMLYGDPIPPEPENENSPEFERKVVTKKVKDKIQKTSYGYRIGFVFAFLLITGISICSAMFLLGGGKKTEKVNTNNSYCTTGASSTPQTTEEPLVMQEGRLSKKEENLLKGYGEEFVNVLVQINIYQYQAEQIMELRDSLNCHGLDKQLKKEIDKDKEIVVSGSAIEATAMTNGMDSQRTGIDVVKKLVNDTLLVNTEEEMKIFGEGFREFYDRLPQDRKLLVKENLQKILDC